jgi:hypothetical protein
MKQLLQMKTVNTIYKVVFFKAADSTKCRNRLIAFQSVSCYSKFFFRTTHESATPSQQLSIISS